MNELVAILDLYRTEFPLSLMIKKREASISNVFAALARYRDCSVSRRTRQLAPTKTL